jgi:fibro-slime domain-containing protein
MKNLIILLCLTTLVLSQTLKTTVRDFRAYNLPNGHIDFNSSPYNAGSVTAGLLSNSLTSAGIPTLSTSATTARDIRDADSFSQWYIDVPTINVRLDYDLIFTTTAGVSKYSNFGFYPIDGKGTNDLSADGHNCLFTLTFTTTFAYTGKEYFNINCDDDCWLYVNNKLALDLGGMHVPIYGKGIDLSTIATTLGITSGNTYSVSFFYAERHETGAALEIVTNAILNSNAVNLTKDTDLDGVPDYRDNCVNIANTDQRDCDSNGIGDACETVRVPVEYPFTAVVSANAPVGADIKVASTFVAIAQGTTYTYQFDDPIPTGSVHSGIIQLYVTLKNPSLTYNCPVALSFTSSTGTSDELTTLVNLNSTTQHIRFFQTADKYYDFKFPPFTGKSTTGKNTLNVRAVTTLNDCGISVGGLQVVLRYTKQTNNVTGYFGQCLNSGGCLFGTSMFNGKCACWSGAWGVYCTMDNVNVTKLTGSSVIALPWAASTSNIANIYTNLDFTAMATKNFYFDIADHPTCPKASWAPQIALGTKAPPTMESAFFQDQALNIIISQPFTNGRAEGCAYLNNPALNSTMPICSYPNSQFIFKTVDGCKDIWRFAVPWKDAQKCGWKISQEEGFQVYKGQVVVINHEWQTSITEWRIIQSVLRIKLRFQRFVSVTVAQNPTVYNTKDLKAAITKQIVAIDLGSPALVELVSVLGYPYRLNEGKLALTPPGKVANFTFTTVDCTVANGQTCRQRWQSTLQLTPDTCTLDGSYRLEWSTGCGDGLTGAACPLVAADIPAAVDFTLQSENFCAEVTVEVGLIGELKSYEEATYATPKVAFIVGRTAYFLVTINSDQNPTGDYNDATASIKFTKTKLVTVSVRQGGTTNVIRIFEKSAPAVFDAASDVKTDCKELVNAAVNKVGFSFVFSTELSKTLQPNGKQTFTIGAEVQVSYAGARKRGILVDGAEKSAFDAEAGFDGLPTTSATTGTETGTSDSYIVIVSLFSLLLSLLM